MISSEQILNARIFIVEDDRGSRTLLKRVLGSSGFKDIQVFSQAYPIFQHFDTQPPDLLILDLNLPGMDGFEVMKTLRKSYADDYLPILVISGETENKVHLRALSSGAKDFLTKPYDRPKVLLRCRNMIETGLLYKEVKEKNQNLEADVKERTKALHNSRLDVVRRLGYAAEFRDTDTGSHIVRMSKYCEVVARKLALPEDECDLILHASPLHDVGKIAIPDKILLKPGRLTDEEMEVMRTHAAVGADILADGDSDFLRMAELIAKTHHERWDGKGYPKGLKGKKIPMPGRICSVCDVFDALISARPYKKPWSFNKAAEEVRKMSGTYFDPDVVKAFLAILPKIRKIRRETAKAFNDEENVKFFDMLSPCEL